VRHSLGYFFVAGTQVCVREPQNLALHPDLILRSTGTSAGAEPRRPFLGKGHSQRQTRSAIVGSRGGSDRTGKLRMPGDGAVRRPLFLSAEGEGFKPTNLKAFAFPSRAYSTRDWIPGTAGFLRSSALGSGAMPSLSGGGRGMGSNNLLRVAGSPRSCLESANTCPSPIARGRS
jgi:hypothetical protein